MKLNLTLFRGLALEVLKKKMMNPKVKVYIIFKFKFFFINNIKFIINKGV
jgi:hypothetical protein